MPKFKRTAVALAAAALLLAGCSSTPTIETVEVLPAPDEATAPGTTLGIGETGWVPYEGNDQLVGTTVLEVTALDPESIDGFADDPQFEGYEPYAVFVQYNSVNTPDLLPIDDQGEVTAWLANDIGNVAMGDADACGKETPEWDTEVGAQVECIVALSDSGPVVGAVFNGSTRNDLVIDEDHEYAQEPVTWR